MKLRMHSSKQRQRKLRRVDLAESFFGDVLEIYSSLEEVRDQQDQMQYVMKMRTSAPLVWPGGDGGSTTLSRF